MRGLRRQSAATIARLFVSMYGGLVLWAACATSASKGSGESHFLECDTDADCADAGAKTKCVNRECVQPQVAIIEGGTNESGTDAPDASRGIQCPAGCRGIVDGIGRVESNCVWNFGYAPAPTDSFIACDCSDAAPTAPPTCHRRVSDGQGWVFSATNLLNPELWTACTPEQEEATGISCWYGACERLPRTLCSATALCKAISCGGAEYDENGCRRLPCTGDAECRADERCTLTVVQQMPCTPANGPVCECPPPLPGPPNMGSFCNPVASVGQRGDWTELEVERVEGPPPQTAAFTWYWRIGPDGGLMGSRQGLPITSMLNVGDLDRLRLIADGPEFRAALRDGIPCDPPPGDVLITFRLKFGTETLERIATGCALTGPAGNVFESLYNLVEQY